MRIFLRKQGRRYPVDPGLSRAQEHIAQGQVHEIGTWPIHRTILKGSVETPSSWPEREARPIPCLSVPPKSQDFAGDGSCRGVSRLGYKLVSGGRMSHEYLRTCNVSKCPISREASVCPAISAPRIQFRAGRVVVSDAH
jgi:hypothetical protein